MNNKGMTLVELIVTFSLLIVIVIGLYQLILDVKFNYEEKDVTKSYTEFSATISSEIQYKLLKTKPTKVEVNDNSVTITDSKSKKYTIKLNTGNDNDEIGITYGGVTEVLPNSKFVEIGRDENQPEVKIEKDKDMNYLIINFPIYYVQNDDPENYGFKIVYPYETQKETT